MTELIRFGGPAPPAAVAGGGPTDLSGLMQEFLHYLAKIWLLEHESPHDAAGLARFDLDRVIADYREHRARNREIPLGDGLDVEESFLLTQIVAGRPLRCLLNSAMPEVPTARIERITSLDPAALVQDVRGRWKIELDARTPMSGQLARWGTLAPAFTALVYDRVKGFGHCVLLRGVERASGSFVYWDPWPLRSLLCAENNEAGADARLVDQDQFLWALEPASMERVLFAVFVPAAGVT
ncbi:MULTISPECIES: hypothetical protein [Nonomuraea]|uniref:Uncharacterized protein n=1 Tax=Nonomuraea ferruginea TaxID=46174 RepID=A0ABT4SZE3_9ACTN|nr:hypothetical protein [Nonomuraea ferruginea]MDA0642230.1 hypothetical protein [Nonomuraea ferruginea]